MISLYCIVHKGYRAINPPKLLKKTGKVCPECEAMYKLVTTYKDIHVIR